MKKSDRTNHNKNKACHSAWLHVQPSHGTFAAQHQPRNREEREKGHQFSTSGLQRLWAQGFWQQLARLRGLTPKTLAAAAATSTTRMQRKFRELPKRDSSQPHSRDRRFSAIPCLRPSLLVFLQKFASQGRAREVGRFFLGNVSCPTLVLPSH